MLRRSTNERSQKEMSKRGKRLDSDEEMEKSKVKTEEGKVRSWEKLNCVKIREN